MKTTQLLCFTFLIAVTGVSCNSPEQKNMPAVQKGITQTDWGTVDGNKAYLYTLTNTKGTVVRITNYGGIVTYFALPDKNGDTSSIVVGFNDLNSYLKKPPYFGALIGRYGNRIARAQFKLDGKTYHLAANNGKNSLHGGLKGFDKVVWNATVVSDSLPQLTLTYLSRDGEEGYPGNLKAIVTYTLSDDNELKIEYQATTDKPTPLNLTNHSYFNLTGNVDNTILNHKLMIDADAYTPVDTSLIPTGELKPVKETPFDFTTAKPIGRDIDSVPGGYDHNFVLNNKTGNLQKAAELSDSASGRTLEVYTTEPGLQFYTGNFLDGSFTNHDGKSIKLHTALCMETQHFPDSPNEPSFPSTILKPGQEYKSTTVYKVITK